MSLPADSSTLAGGAFPPTRHSVLAAAKSADPAERARAMDTLAAAYWKPVYKHLRLRWRLEPADAEDVTQGFFARALEKHVFERFDPSRARLRTYLRACLDSFAANERKAAGRLKRGGGVKLVSLDFGGAEDELRRIDPADPADPEAAFEREWVRSLFALALERMRAAMEARGKGVQFRLFERYDVENAGAPERLTYRQLADEHGLAVTQVTNWLFAARRDFRRTVLELLRELSGSDEEFRAEARALLGSDAP